MANTASKAAQSRYRRAQRSRCRGSAGGPGTERQTEPWARRWEQRL